MDPYWANKTQISLDTFSKNPFLIIFGDCFREVIFVILQLKFLPKNSIFETLLSNPVLKNEVLTHHSELSIIGYSLIQMPAPLRFSNFQICRLKRLNKSNLADFLKVGVSRFPQLLIIKVRSWLNFTINGENLKSKEKNIFCLVNRNSFEDPKVQC